MPVANLTMPQAYAILHTMDPWQEQGRMDRFAPVQGDQ